MSYRHCHNCDCELDKPTIQKDLIDGQTCPMCSYTMPQDQSVEEWLVELWEKVNDSRNN